MTDQPKPTVHIVPGFISGEPKPKPDTLAERLRLLTRMPHHPRQLESGLREAADALEAKEREIERLKNSIELLERGKHGRVEMQAEIERLRQLTEALRPDSNLVVVEQDVYEKVIKENERLNKACAELRSFLEECLRPYLNDPDRIYTWVPIQVNPQKVREALSTDCGRDYVPRESIHAAKHRLTHGADLEMSFDDELGWMHKDSLAVVNELRVEVERSRKMILVLKDSFEKDYVHKETVNAERDLLRKCVEVLQMCREVEGTQSRSYDPDEYTKAIDETLSTASSLRINPSSPKTSSS